MAAAREGNIGSASTAGPLLWVAAQPDDINHSRTATSPTDTVVNLLPLRAIGRQPRGVREYRNRNGRDFRDWE